MTDNTQEMCQAQALGTRELLEEVWAAIDSGEEYEGQDATQYLDEMPLEIVFERGEPFAVVLGTVGPHVEITGGGRSSFYSLSVYWAGESATVYGEAIDRTGEYFRESFEDVS